MKKNFLQTHFVGVSVPLELEDFVRKCRDYMNAAYGCKSGYGTPPHVTIIPPFALDEKFSDRDVFNAAELSFFECVQKNVIPFTAKIFGFGAFSNRTIFINVEDSKNWQDAHSIFEKIFSRQILFQTKKSKRKFFPHLTIANRDIPKDAVDAALKHFAELNLQTQFVVKEICVYTKKDFGSWHEAKRFCV